MNRPLRTLLLSTLYPSSVRPSHGIFVETRLRETLKTGQLETVVVAPVPWFPFSGKRWGVYGQFAATPYLEQHNGIEVHHPRYSLLPKVGMNMAPDSMARAVLPVIKRIQVGFDFDLIDAHYYYPDGVAAAIVAKALAKPFVVTARGSDINMISQFSVPKRRVLEAAHQAAGSVGVCRDLVDTLAAMGADPSKLHVLRNGVDLERFRPEDQQSARRRVGLSDGGNWWLSVGRLVELKGHHIAIEALSLVPSVKLCIVGHGPESDGLRQMADRLGVSERVQFAGNVPNEELRWWYSAADALLLCSSSEGWANVLLEAMACGTPVIATRVAGTPEVVQSDVAGQLMHERSAPALAQAWARLRANAATRQAVRSYAQAFGWEPTAQGCLALFQRAATSAGS